jgi:hypothetical protein
MATHNVWFDIPERRLGATDVNFYIYADGEVFGKLSVSNGSIVWFPKGSRNGRKMAWKKFDELMRENTGRRERRK